MSKMKKEFHEEIVKKLDELYERAYHAANRNITLRFFIELDEEWVDDVHVMDGTEYRQKGNKIQVALSTGMRRDKRFKKNWIESQMDRIEREYEMKDWMP